MIRAGGRDLKASSCRVVTALLLVIATGYLPLPANGEEIGKLSLRIFLETYVEALQSDGKLDVSSFDCKLNNSTDVQTCKHPASGFGFQFKSEPDVETVSVRIILQDDEPPSNPMNASGNYVFVSGRAAFEQLRQQFASLLEDAESPLKTQCKVRLESGPRTSDDALYFAAKNPSSGTVILLLFAGSEYHRSNIKGFFDPRLGGYHVGTIMILNNLTSKCQEHA